MRFVRGAEKVLANAQPLPIMKYAFLAQCLPHNRFYLSLLICNGEKLIPADKKNRHSLDGIAFCSNRRDKDKTIKERAGIAVSLRDVDARLYGYTDTISFTRGDSLPSAINFPVWGVGVNFSGLIGIPLSVQTGTLVTGGSLSRLRSPELSSPYLFSSAFSLPKGVETSLPTLSSSKKNIASSFLSEVKTGMFTTRVCAVADEDGMASSSLSLAAALPRMMETGMCVTGGFFPIKDKKAHTSSPAWYAPAPYFKDCKIGAASLQTYCDSPVATCILTGNVYEQPERDNAVTGRAEASFHGDVFSLRTGVFAVNKALSLDTEGQYIKKTFQVMAQ